MAKKYDIALEQKIVSAYSSGISPYEMVKTFPELQGKRPSVVYGVLKRLGINSHRQIKLTEDQKLNRRIYNCNDSYFETIDTEEKAYWLGFLYADGFINTNTDVIGITLAVKDKDHLKKFKKAISFTGQIKEYVQTSGYAVGNIYARILIRSGKMKRDLKDKGIVENKTLLLKFPTCVPSHLIHDFIRGYIDGDGCITTQKHFKTRTEYAIKITGTKEMLLGIQDVFNLNLTLEQRYPERNVNNYSITISGNNQVERILDLLYKNSTIHLTRKYIRYLEFKQYTVVHGQARRRP